MDFEGRLETCEKGGAGGEEAGVSQPPCLIISVLPEGNLEISQLEPCPPLPIRSYLRPQPTSSSSEDPPAH